MLSNWTTSATAAPPCSAAGDGKAPQQSWIRSNVLALKHGWVGLLLVPYLLLVVIVGSSNALHTHTHTTQEPDRPRAARLRQAPPQHHRARQARGRQRQQHVPGRRGLPALCVPRAGARRRRLRLRAGHAAQVRYCLHARSHVLYLLGCCSIDPNTNTASRPSRTGWAAASPPECWRRSPTTPRGSWPCSRRWV